MPTQCTAEQLEFAGVERRRVVAAFVTGAGPSLRRYLVEVSGIVEVKFDARGANGTRRRNRRRCG